MKYDFILKDKDELAPFAILEWIKQGLEKGVNRDKLSLAANHLSEILSYQHNIERKLPD